MCYDVFIVQKTMPYPIEPYCTAPYSKWIKSNHFPLPNSVILIHEPPNDTHLELVINRGRFDVSTLSSFGGVKAHLRTLLANEYLQIGLLRGM